MHIYDFRPKHHKKYGGRVFVDSEGDKFAKSSV